MNTLDLRAVIAGGWRAYRNQWVVLSGLTLVFMIINMSSSIGDRFFDGLEIVSFVILSLIFSIWTLIVGVKTAIVAADGQPVSFNQLITEMSLFRFVQVVGAYFLFGFIFVIIAGLSMLLFILMINSGLIKDTLDNFLLMMFLFFVGFIFVYTAVISQLVLIYYILLDKNADLITALRENFVLTKGVKWPLLLLLWYLIAINIIGTLFFGIGLLVSMPLTLVTLAVVYRRLSFKVI
ncbi:MAG: hypothetical protein ACOCU8_03495 [Patescibacteria group bacterium]